ncbi:hypothetical protein CSU72_04490 [Salmonella enterica subsp. enterica serovar Infantis]|nr:hypothetical protein [Salmonella enterica subsp. enterica serovar Infantis]
MSHKLEGIASAAALSLYLLTPAHADEFSGFQGSISGGIPAYTRTINQNDKPFWCNQYKLLRKECRVVDVTPNGRVAIVQRPGDETCPGGWWGAVDRHNGDAIWFIPTRKELSSQKACSKAFRVGFVQPSAANVIAAVAMYYGTDTISTIEYSE